MFAGTALSVCLLVYAGLSLFIISGPYLYVVVCVLYAYNLTIIHVNFVTYCELFIVHKKSDMSEFSQELVVHFRIISIHYIIRLQYFVSEILDFPCVSGFWLFSGFLDLTFLHVRNFTTNSVYCISQYFICTHFKNYLNVGQMSLYELPHIQ